MRPWNLNTKSIGRPGELNPGSSDRPSRLVHTVSANWATEAGPAEPVFVLFSIRRWHKSNSHFFGGTGVRELMRGLATLPQRWIQEPLVVRDRDGRPQTGPSGSALLCVAGVHCWEISLELADPWICLSCWFILWFSCVYSLCIVS